jgi:hypothetical protein
MRPKILTALRFTHSVGWQHTALQRPSALFTFLLQVNSYHTWSMLGDIMYQIWWRLRKNLVGY